MGLEEYIKAGAKLQRNTVTLITDEIGSGSVDLGSTYVLLTVTTTAPCRLRLYDTNQSLENNNEIIRLFGNTNVSDSTALIGDFSMSSAGTYTIDPVMYGVVENPLDKLTYYRINGTQPGEYPTITFTRYLMEDSSKSIKNRTSLPQITASLLPTEFVSGTLTSTTIPRTYLLVSASVMGSSNLTRLRLYSTKESLTNTTELSRPFVTESSNTSKLIIDAILTGSQITYFVPKIVGANLQTAGVDLNVIKNNKTAIMGNNELYYVLENLGTTGGTEQVTASLHVFSLED